MRKSKSKLYVIVEQIEVDDNAIYDFDLVYENVEYCSSNNNKKINNVKSSSKPSCDIKRSKKVKKIKVNNTTKVTNIKDNIDVMITKLVQKNHQEKRTTRKLKYSEVERGRIFNEEMLSDESIALQKGFKGTVSEYR